MHLRTLTIIAAVLYSAAALSQEVPAKRETTMEKWAVQNGFEHCRPTLEKIGRFLVGNNRYASHDFTHKSNGNENVFSSLIVKDYSDGGSHINFVVAPVASGACNWTYTESSIYEKACQLVREQSFPTFTFVDEANGDSIIISNDESLYYYLTPSESGNNCLVTKREVVVAD